MNKVWIPEVSEDQIKKLAAKIKPIVQFGKTKSYIKDVDLFGVAYTWSAKKKLLPRVGKLKTLKDITTYHTYGYYGMFKPSIAEVLAQIPSDLQDRAVAFEIIRSPETSEDLNENLDALNAGYHVATTRLYERV